MWNYAVKSSIITTYAEKRKCGMINYWTGELLGRPVTVGERSGRLIFITAGQLPAAGRQELSPVLQQAFSELGEYAAGQRREFSLPLEIGGTVFQQLVWQELMRLPYGETCTYGQLAARIGRPSAARAVGGALNKNPLLIVVPCHRVIGHNGSLTGFALGLDFKRRLLELEGVKCYE